MGTPEFAALSLQAILNSRHHLCGVVTQPDRPRGRGRKLQPSPVKLLAAQHGVPVLQPESVNRRAVREQVSAWEPELIVVAAFGQMLCRQYLTHPAKGAINVHASLLPRHRGASPVHAAILAGDTVTGVTIQRMVKDMDAGAILKTLSTTIADSETASQLERRLAGLGAEALVSTLEEIDRGTVEERPQDESRVTYAPRLSKRDGLIDWALPADYVSRFVRAMTDWPGAFTFWLDGVRGPTRLTVLEAVACDQPTARGQGEQSKLEPGTIIGVDARSIVVSAGRGAVCVRRLQPAGKRAMPASDFLRGHKVQPGQLFGVA